jgi:hypothetical protein
MGKKADAALDWSLVICMEDYLRIEPRVNVIFLKRRQDASEFHSLALDILYHLLLLLSGTVELWTRLARRISSVKRMMFSKCFGALTEYELAFVLVYHSIRKLRNRFRRDNIEYIRQLATGSVQNLAL